jgi:radical SAM protein (TIGR01212 family)
MENRYYDLNTYFRNQYGQRVHKITVDAGMTCPNRDGTVGMGGCIYCNSRGSGTGAYHKGLSITEQLTRSKAAVAKRFKAKLFLAYFQSFTNTYGSVEHLRILFDEALAVADIVGLAIGTRPDCIDGDKLDLLESYARHHLVWLEYGLQSAHDATLKRINRGHDVECFAAAVQATAGRGIRIGAHIILGLPGESAADVRNTADFLAQLPIDGVKLHLLYVVRGTPMEALYRSGSYQCLTQDQYVEMVCDVLARLPARMVILRLTSDPHADELVAPGWALEKQAILEKIQRRLADRDIRQGYPAATP